MQLIDIEMIANEFRNIRSIGNIERIPPPELIKKKRAFVFIDSFYWNEYKMGSEMKLYFTL